MRLLCDGLTAEGKRRIADLSPPDGESLSELLKKGELKPVGSVADAQWALGQWGDGAFADVAGQYVAVYRLAVVGTGNDPVELAIRCAGACGVSQSRIVIKYVGRED